MAKREHFPYSVLDLPELDNGECLLPFDHAHMLGLGLTSRCNFDCPMCYYHDSSGTSEGADMPLELIRKIMKGCGDLRNVNVSLEGEPFLHPRVFDALDFISGYAESISLSTNGALLNKDKINRLRQYRFSAFSMSIDADSGTFYKIFRGGGTLEIFERHAALASECLEGTVSFNTVLFRENINHVAGIPALAKRCGVNRVSLMQLRPHAGARARGITSTTEAELLTCLGTLAEEAEKWGVELVFDPFFGNARVMQWLQKNDSEAINVLPSPVGWSCVFPWHYASILSDGRLFPCCGDFGPITLENYDFDGIYNHPVMQRLRQSLIRGMLPQACRACHFLT